MTDSYDCVVMGGGPAGSTAAALVAQAGWKTLLVERDTFPRFHVGESLMPETYDTFKRLGVLDQMKTSDFVKKISVQFVSHRGTESQPFNFLEHDPGERTRTWQVERSRFDQMLLENAAAKGAECRQGVRVTEVLWEDRRAAGVKVQLASGEVQSIPCRVVIDATGQQALMAGAMGLKRTDDKLRKAAIWTYYQGAARDPGEHGGATIILHTQSKDAWFWSIPLSGDVTSVGVVGDNDFLLKGRGAPEQAFAEELANCPALGTRLAQATRVNKYFVAKEFSYSTERSAGDGWVLVGDAWGFIDPIYSSGVFFALKSAELAADCVIEGLERGDLSAAQLGRWVEPFAAGTHWIRKLVRAFYHKPFSFGRFIGAYPQHKANLTDLLIGRIFQAGSGKIFEDLDPWLEETDRDAEPVPPVDTTGDV